MSASGSPRSPSPRERIRERLAALWEAHKHVTAGQIDMVELAARALLAGDADQDLRDKAAREAHKLAGTVGTFGFTDAARLARELELSFEAGGADLSEERAVRIVELAARLRRELDAGLEPSPPQR